MQIVEVDGIEFPFTRSTRLVVPPLTLKALKQLRKRGVDLAQIDLSDASLDTVVAAATAALKRNYPEMTVDQVEDLIDVSNMADVLACVLDVSGLRRKAAATAAKAAEGDEGKAAGATTSGASTGTP